MCTLMLYALIRLGSYDRLEYMFVVCDASLHGLVAKGPCSHPVGSQRFFPQQGGGAKPGWNLESFGLQENAPTGGGEREKT